MLRVCWADAAELRGLVLLQVTLPKAWERVVRLSFGPRLSERPSHHVHLEVMGRSVASPCPAWRPHLPQEPMPQQKALVAHLTHHGTMQLLGPAAY